MQVGITYGTHPSSTHIDKRQDYMEHVNDKDFKPFAHKYPACHYAINAQGEKIGPFHKIVNISNTSGDNATGESFGFDIPDSSKIDEEYYKSRKIPNVTKLAPSVAISQISSYQHPDMLKDRHFKDDTPGISYPRIITPATHKEFANVDAQGNLLIQTRTFPYDKVYKQGLAFGASNPGSTSEYCHQKGTVGGIKIDSSHVDAFLRSARVHCPDPIVTDGLSVRAQSINGQRLPKLECALEFTRKPIREVNTAHPFTWNETLSAQSKPDDNNTVCEVVPHNQDNNAEDDTSSSEEEGPDNSQI
jgi:hypothetical protein